MAIPEKYIATRINLDEAPDAIFPSGDRKFLPGDLLDAENVDVTTDGRIKSIKGNLLKTYSSLGSGTNKCIGTILYRKERTIIFFIWNSTGEHRVVEYNPKTEVFSTLLQGSTLNFQESSYINQGGTIDDILVWTDKINPIRKINIQRAKSGFYTVPYSNAEISLVATPPLTPPTAVLVSDSSVAVNRISEFNWQFTYQFGYIDNELSVFSNYSKLISGGIIPYKNNTVNNAIDVTITIPAELIGVVSFVNILFRKGNTGDFNIFKIIRNPSQTSITTRFTAFEAFQAVAKTEETKYADAIPPRNDALSIIKNRVFVTLNSVGFNIDETTFSFATSVVTETAVVGKRYFKEGGSYAVGVLFEDEFGNKSFVKAINNIKLPFIDSFAVPAAYNPGVVTDYVGGMPLNEKKKLAWTLTGTPPAGMKKYQIVITKNKFQSIYEQFTTPLLGYQRDLKEGDEFENNEVVPADPGEFSAFTWRGRVYSIGGFLNDPALGQCKFIALRIPTNMAFVPEKGDFIRFCNPGYPVRTARILEVLDGDVVLTDIDIRLSNTLDALDQFGHAPFVEIYRIAELKEDVFYEIGETFDIVNNQFSVTSGEIYGDTYWFSKGPVNENEANEFFPFFNYDALEYSGFQPMAITPIRYHVVESPTGIATSVAVSGSVNGVPFNGPRAYVFDYTKSDGDWGRAFTQYYDEKKENLKTVVGISDPYVQNSKVNGLSSFTASNQYDLPVDLTPVTALAKAGGVLLAIHEEYCSSLYVGEGFIKTGNDFILAKTQDIVGDDRQLDGSYGCINPESVLEANDNVFFWDMNRGAVVRYTRAGLFPVSNYRMRNFFLEKGRLLLRYMDRVKVYTAYDYTREELIITFTTVFDDNGNVIVPGQTWRFNTSTNEWKGRYAFLPESYGFTTTELVSFVDGQLWHHNQNPLHNNFYGVQYTRKWKFVCNPYLGKAKLFLNVHIEGDIAADTDSEFAVVTVSTKEGQKSYIPASKFKLELGKWNGPILKDINSPVGVNQLALLSGKDIISNYLIVEIDNNRTDEAPCAQANVIYINQEFSI